jgi:peptidoglycan/xylan/chitin deacetylase (PgdA/CDA1 family)
MPVNAETYAPIFAYFQIGRDDNPNDNLRIEQFQAQVDALKSDAFTVVSLPAIIAAFDGGAPLPDHAVGLTFDEASRSIADNALPLLRKAGMTATIFVTPALADRGGAYMDWDDLRRAARDGFTIGAKIDLDALDDDTPERIMAAVNESLTRIQDQIGVAPVVFSYSDGIADRSIRDIVKSRGFKAAVALQSGPASDKSDRFLLPRFAMTESYGTLERFRMAANSMPLIANDLLPADSIITGQNPPQIGFTVLSDDVALTQLACFTEGQGKTPLTVLGTRAELRPVAAFGLDDTTRVNCTAPGTGNSAGRWHWLGFDFYVPDKN